MMQYAQVWSQPVCTRRVYAVRPPVPGRIASPQAPSPPPNRSAVVRSAASSNRAVRRSLSRLSTMSDTPGSAATAAPSRDA
jgi:hypothetical protein